MPLQHIVLLKTRPGLDGRAFDRILTDAQKKLATIPGVSNLRAGVSADSNSAWNIALSMDFADQEALEAYRAHPVHVAYVQDNLDENVVERKALDFLMDG